MNENPERFVAIQVNYSFWAVLDTRPPEGLPCIIVYADAPEQAEDLASVANSSTPDKGESCDT